MHTISDHSVLPFDGMGLYPQARPRSIYKMPRVVPDQKSKFENDEHFRRLSRECEVSSVYIYLRSCCFVSTFLHIYLSCITKI